MRKTLLLLLTAVLAMAAPSFTFAEDAGAVTEADLFRIWETDGETMKWVAGAVPFSEGVVITSSGLLPENTEHLVVSDGDNTWEAKAVIPDDTGMIAMVFHDPDEKTSGKKNWLFLPWGETVPAASCTVRYADETGRTDSCGVLAAEDFHMQGRRFLLLTLTAQVKPGSAVLTGDGCLAGIVTAEWAGGKHRVLALPAEEIIGSLQEAAAFLNNLPEWGNAPEGLKTSAEKNRVTIDWKEMTLPEKAEGEQLYMVLADTANNYLNFYPAETQSRTLSLLLTPGRIYAAGLVASAERPDRIPETFAVIRVPEAGPLTEFGFHPIMTALAEGTEEKMKDGGTPSPVTEVTEEMLRSGRAYFYSRSAYQVDEKVEDRTLLITLTDTNGVNYTYESSWIYIPECMTDDLWYLSLQDAGLTAALDRNGYPAGTYRMAYYVDGDLADAFEFELK